MNHAKPHFHSFWKALVFASHYRCPGHECLWILFLSNIHDNSCIFAGSNPNKFLVFLITFWDQLGWEWLFINYFYLFHSDCPLIRAILKKDNILHLRLYMQISLKYSLVNNVGFQLKKTNKKKRNYQGTGMLFTYRKTFFSLAT